MSLPLFSETGARLYDAMRPAAEDVDQDHDYTLAHLCEAVARMWQPVADLSDPDDVAGWATLVDVELAPDYALGWLAQVAGVRLTQSATADVQRVELRRVSGRARGRPATMVAAAQETLTGTRTVRLVERSGGNAWQLVAITRTSETPDATVTLAALMGEKPAGIVLTHIVSDDPVWVEATRTWDAVVGTVTWDAVTLGDVT